MHTHLDPLRLGTLVAKTGCFLTTGCCVAFLGAAVLAAQDQVPPSQSEAAPAALRSTPAIAPASPADAVPATAAADSSHAAKPKDLQLNAGDFSLQTKGGEIDENQLKQLLIGKTLYLREGYLDNNLEFDEWGRLTGHSPRGSFTLSQIQINKVKLSKHALKLEGDRYALHFLGAAPFEDPTKATDRVKITPKKKTVRISFDREEVEKPKKKKHKHPHKQDEPANKRLDQESSDTAAPISPAQTEQPGNLAGPSGEKATKTTDPVHSSKLLLTALDNVFSRGVDDRMIAAMPDFWRLYYQSAAQKTDYREPGVLLQNAVDQKAKLISAIDPPSNEFAQANSVAGMALYRVILDSNGKVEKVVASRPIGFGLDENAEQTIRKATFQPAEKDGKPVPVALDLVVSFRIYSNRTSKASTNPQDTQASSVNPALPGPYTLQALEQARAAQQSQPAPQTQPSGSTSTQQ
jgi:TonB family protein